MKKTVILFILLLLLIIKHPVFSQNITINQAASDAARSFSGSIPSGSRIAILNIVSDDETISNQIINSLIQNLLDARLFSVVPRDEIAIAAARSEFIFQESGFVSEATQRDFGKFLGADTIITGSVTKASGNTHRLVLNAIHLERFEYIGLYETLIGRGSRNNNNSDNFFDSAARFGGNVGYALLNPVFGLGSYLQGDTVGGLWLMLAYLASYSCIAAELILYDYWADNAGLWGTVGLGIAVPAVLIGSVRPFVYSRNTRKGLAQVFNGAYVSIVPAVNDGMDISIIYSVRF